jgi:hypothetical protein
MRGWFFEKGHGKRFDCDHWRNSEMKGKMPALIAVSVFFFATVLKAQSSSREPWEVSPPVTKTDLQIAQRAREILNSPAKWNRADTRVCPAQARAFSLYCALEKATLEVTGQFQHRGAAMQQARFAIEDLDPNWRLYHHRLMDYNNDPRTTFPDIQRVLHVIQDRIVKRLSEQARHSEK